MTLRDSRGNYISSPMLGETVYEYDFYSGSVVLLMIGDVLIDNCVGVQYSVEQSSVPIYGYANQYYTFLADGKVLVSGNLTIAFKEAGYLFWPIRRFINQKVQGQWTTPRYDTTKGGRITRGYDLSQSNGTFTNEANKAQAQKVMRASVEQMASWQHSNIRSGARYNRFWQELGAMEDNVFEDWAEVFEDAIWFSDSVNPLIRDKLFSNNLDDTAEMSEEDVLSHRRADQYPPIDIWITYGDTNRQAVNHTVKKIMDVSFIGQSQVIEISGDPVYETYQFIARNVV